MGQEVPSSTIAKYVLILTRLIEESQKDANKGFRTIHSLVLDEYPRKYSFLKAFFPS